MQDYYLKGCIEGRNLKINISGSNIALMVPPMESTISTWRLIGLPQKSGDE